VPNPKKPKPAKPDADTPPMCQECDVEMCYGEGYDGDGRLIPYYRCDECGWSVDV